MREYIETIARLAQEWGYDYSEALNAAETVISGIGNVGYDLTRVSLVLEGEI